MLHDVLGVLAGPSSVILATFMQPATGALPSRASIAEDFADPAVIRAVDGNYYAYATGSSKADGSRQISVSVSRDRVIWTKPKEALPEKPAWAKTKKKFWAPHVVARTEGGKTSYVMFFAAEPDTSKHENMRIGVALSESPDGPFIPLKSPLATDAEENIDPMVFEDPLSKRHYLYWGRNGNIAVQELAPSLTSFAEGSSARNVLVPSGRKYEKIVEAPYVVYHEGWYYLFYSGDDCCERKHYAVMVARSRVPTAMFHRAAQPFLEGNRPWKAPGHNSVFADERGELWLAYHAYDSRKARTPARHMLLSQMEFVGGWPTVAKRSE